MALPLIGEHGLHAGMHVQTSRCIVLQNCFDAQQEAARLDNEGWEEEIEADVKAECQNFGAVEHCKLERDTGCIYAKFADVNTAMRARSSLNGRFFGGQAIIVDFVPQMTYDMRFRL